MDETADDALSRRPRVPSSRELLSIGPYGIERLATQLATPEDLSELGVQVGVALRELGSLNVDSCERAYYLGLDIRDAATNGAAGRGGVSVSWAMDGIPSGLVQAFLTGLAKADFTEMRKALEASPAAAREKVEGSFPFPDPIWDPQWRSLGQSRPIWAGAA